MRNLFTFTKKIKVYNDSPTADFYNENILPPIITVKTL